MNPEILARAKELESQIAPATFQEMVEEVRESLPPTKTMRSRYMKNCQRLI